MELLNLGQAQRAQKKHLEAFQTLPASPQFHLETRRVLRDYPVEPRSTFALHDNCRPDCKYGTTCVDGRRSTLSPTSSANPSRLVVIRIVSYSVPNQDLISCAGTSA